MLLGLFACIATIALRLLTIPAGIAAGLIGGLTWEAGGWRWAVPLLIFFVTSAVLSRLPDAMPSLHICKPKREGYAGRNLAQVLANGGVAGVCALAFLITRDPKLFPAYVGSLAAANADTWATEIGTRYGRAFFRITTLERTPAGRDGAVSAVGLLASFGGAWLVALSLGTSFGSLSAVMATVAFASALLDSLLGDTLQADYEGGPNATAPSRGYRWLTNSGVNFICTLSAGVACYLAATWASR